MITAAALPLSILPAFAAMYWFGHSLNTLTSQFGSTAAIAMLASLLVARLLTPMMAAHLVRGHSRKEDSDGRLVSRYLGAVRWCLDHRKATGVATLALFGRLDGAVVPPIPMSFTPRSDSDFTRLSVQLPPGSSLDRTLHITEQARHALRGVDGIRSVFTTVGQPQGGDN